MNRLIVTSKFVKLLREITPLNSEVTKAKSQFMQIRSRLNKSFKIARVVVIGSHAKNTAIKTYSDVDIMVVVRREEIRWGDGLISSETLVKKMKDDLNERYSFTEVRKDGQAIVVRFANGLQSVDIVPAVYGSAANSGHPIYFIPDGIGGWLPTSPDAQLKLIKEADENSGGKFKNVIRLIKWWMFSRSPYIPLNSMHLETLLIKNGIKRDRSYANLVSDVFLLLAGRKGRFIHDPLKLSGLFRISKTQTQCIKVLESVDFAVEHALNALEAEEDSNIEEAIKQWKMVFNDQFPS